IGIETDDETPRYPKALVLDEANALQRIASQVLKFLGFRQGLGGGTFDADEDIKKVRLHHSVDQFRPLGEIDRRLGIKQVRIVMASLPLFQLDGELEGELVVADKIVVDDKDLVAPAEFKQPIELRQQLAGTLGSGFPSVEGDDVAELALK